MNPVARQLPTQDNTNRRNADRHPCLEWDSNPTGVGTIQFYWLKLFNEAVNIGQVGNRKYVVPEFGTSL
jgi:hypothetical protein